MELEYQMFKHGSTWIRADFHMHTQIDKEFSFLDPEKNRSFKKEYVEQLKAQNVRLGVITNHNKFDLAEFKSLLKCARKEEIYLMAGVELSVKNGANGVHCLIVFDYEKWILSDENFIEEHFLKAAFEGVANKDNENTSSNYTIEDMLKKLEEHRRNGRDSFVIMAHVNGDKGFLEEVGGNNIEKLANDKLFKNFVIGFQKFRNYDDLPKLKNWFGDNIPVFVEGSDCKSMEEVGKAHVQKNEEKKTYLKLGHFSFESVKFALTYHQGRVSTSVPKIQPIHLGKITIENRSGITEIPLNSSLNTIIGIRGGGKSSLLETLRFGLGIELSPKDYKNEIVRRLLGAGGKITLDFFNDVSTTHYRIERVWGNNAKIYDENNTLKNDLKSENLIEIAYFGQKDLEEIGKDFNETIIEEKLLKKQLEPFKKVIEDAKIEVRHCVENIQAIKNESSKKADIQNRIAEDEEFIRKFNEYGLEDKLKKELNFESDITQVDTIFKERLESITKSLSDELNTIDLSSMYLYTPKEIDNQSFFDEYIIPSIRRVEEFINEVKVKLDKKNSHYILNDFISSKKDFLEKFEKLKEEFLEIKKQINDPNINVEKYKNAQRNILIEREKLSNILKAEEKISSLKEQLNQKLKNLEIAWRKEHNFIQNELEKLNSQESSFKIELLFQGDKDRFKDELFDKFTGTNLQRDHHCSMLANSYENLISVYNDLEVPNSELYRTLSGGSLVSSFKKKFETNLYQLLTHRTPDNYSFLYNGKDLQNYSIGQKATALIAFVLSNKHKNLFIIDQPEDDLDNHTVAKEIIERIRYLKPNTQFIFVTHNPNILVLGDSEQIVVCQYESDTVKFAEIGSIDKVKLQEMAINILEGGKKAFQTRSKIYQSWKPLKQ